MRQLLVGSRNYCQWIRAHQIWCTTSCRETLQYRPRPTGDGRREMQGNTPKQRTMRDRAVKPTRTQKLQDFFWPGLTYLQDSASLKGRCSAYGI